MKQFFQGMGWPWVRVDYSTRHYSRAYEIGLNTQKILVVGLPISVLVGIGFILGRYL